MSGASTRGKMTAAGKPAAGKPVAGKPASTKSPAKRPAARKPVVDKSVAQKKRDSAYDKVLTAIIFGDLAAGSVVEEAQLVRRFGEGLAGIRDALYRLSLEGLIERQPRIGTRVLDVNVRDLQDIFEARVAIEGCAAALAAERASEEDLARLKSAFSGYEQVIQRRDFRKLVMMDRAFHLSMVRATKNAALIESVLRLHNRAMRFWYFGLARLPNPTIKSDIESHLRVITAIEKRSPLGAEKAMRAVLARFPESVMSFMDSSFPVQRRYEHGGSQLARRRGERSEGNSGAASVVSGS